MDQQPAPPSPNEHDLAQPAMLAAIAVGGALGGITRVALFFAVPAAAAGFPWATFWTNVAGSFTLGALVIVAAARVPSNHYVGPFLGTGFLGSFTTFSAFAAQASGLLDRGSVWTAASYAAGTLGVGLLAAWMGIALARRAVRGTSWTGS